MKKLPFKTEHLLLGVCTVCCLYLTWKLNVVQHKLQAMTEMMDTQLLQAMAVEMDTHIQDWSVHSLHLIPSRRRLDPTNPGHRKPLPGPIVEDKD